jgi:phenylacetate-CoA ligase
MREKDKASEEGLLSALRARLAALQAFAPVLALQLEGVDVASLQSASDFSRIPLLRKSDLPAMQRAAPPFGGLAGADAGRFKRLFLSPGPIFEAQDFGSDPFGAKAALAAAGFRAGDVVLNCFAYHLTPGGFIMESGAHALGCATIPAGPGNTEQTLQAIAQLKPGAYCGPPDYLKILLDKAEAADVDASSLRKALVSGAALPASLRSELEQRGVRTRQAYASAELGVIAYETEDADGALEPGLKVHADILVEIVTPGSGDAAPSGAVGEVVVTALRGNYPLLRFATGDLSAFLARDRIRGWMGRADQTTKVKGMFVHPADVIEIGRRHRELGALRLVVRREREQDAMVLMAEVANPSADLAQSVAATMEAVTKLRGDVEFVAKGALPNDGKTIADERPAP